jgi:hypothetical protein
VDAQPRLDEPDELGPAGERLRHGDTERQAGIGPAQAQHPESAVLGRAEHGVGHGAGERLGGGLEQTGRYLRSVHADQHDRHRQGRVGVPHGGGDALVEPAAALRDHVEAVWQPGPGLTGQGEDPADDPGAAYRFQRVGEGGLGQLGGLAGSERRRQPGLDPAGDRLLGQDEHLRREIAHDASTLRMSRTVRMVPPTVPVTLDLPVRG